MAHDLTRQQTPDQPERPRDARRTLRRLFQIALTWKKTLAALAAVTLCSIAFDITTPLMIEGCLNSIRFTAAFIAVDESRFPGYFAALLILCLLSALMGYGNGILSARLSLHMEAELRVALFRKIVRLPLAESERQRAGDLMSRVMNDAGLAAKSFSDALLALFSSLIVIVGSAAVMFSRNVSLAAVSVSSALVSVFLVGTLSRSLFPYFLAQQRALGFLNMHIEESLTAYRSCAAGNRLAENRRLTARYSEDYYRSCIRAARLEGLVEPLMLMLGNLNFLLIVVFGVRLVVAGSLGLGALQAFILYSKQFMEPVSELGECLARVQNSLAGAERVFELLDLPDEDLPARQSLPDGQVKTAAAADEPAVRFENVTFAYRKNRPVLKGLTLRVARGERLALVGATGAGKTTLAALLTRLYTGYGGSIMLDGTETGAIPLPELRRRVGFVPQEPQILSGTIEENIAYGADDPPRERVIEAARAVGLDRVIRRLPAGYETPLGSGGGTMSQGQLQLLGLARALLSDAEVLILDEATSSVDALTELAVRRAIETVMAGRACVLIAHRLASVADADHIAVLRDGVIAEYGTHEELLARNGLYAGLYRRQ